MDRAKEHICFKMKEMDIEDENKQVHKIETVLHCRIQLHLFLNNLKDLPQKRKDVKEIRKENMFNQKVRRLKVKVGAVSKVKVRST